MAVNQLIKSVDLLTESLSLLDDINTNTSGGLGTGNVSSTNNITDNAVLRGDGGAKNIQESLMSIADNGDVYIKGDASGETILRIDTDRYDRGDWRIRINDTNSPADFYIDCFAGGSWNNKVRFTENSQLYLGTTTNNGRINAFNDTNENFCFGRCRLGYNSYNDECILSHYDHFARENCGYRQNSGGETFINSRTNYGVYLRINNSTRLDCRNNGTRMFNPNNTKDTCLIYGNSNAIYAGGWNAGWAGGLRVSDIIGYSAYFQYGTSSSDDMLKSNEEYLGDNTLASIMKIKPEKYLKTTMTDTRYNRLLAEYNSEKALLEEQIANSNDENEITELTEKLNLLSEPKRKTNTECGLIAQQIWYEVPELQYTVELGQDSNPQPIAEPMSDDPNVDIDYTQYGWSAENTASINYDNYIGILIKAIQEQQTIIDDLKSRIEVLENA